MNVLVLDGSPAAGPLGDWLEAFGQELEARGHAVRQVALRDLLLMPCKGCFECWVKTPGRCAIRDDAGEVTSDFLASDLVVAAAPVEMGFTSALLRRMTERLIPIIHPYFAIVGGEFHHRPRYAHYPRLALVHDARDPADARLVEEAHRRTAINMHSEFVLAASTAASPREVCDALDDPHRLAAARA